MKHGQNSPEALAHDLLKGALEQLAAQQPAMPAGMEVRFAARLRAELPALQKAEAVTPKAEATAPKTEAKAPKAVPFTPSAKPWRRLWLPVGAAAAAVVAVLLLWPASEDVPQAMLADAQPQPTVSAPAETKKQPTAAWDGKEQEKALAQAEKPRKVQAAKRRTAEPKAEETKPEAVEATTPTLPVEQLPAAATTAEAAPQLAAAEQPQADAEREADFTPYERALMARAEEKAPLTNLLTGELLQASLANAHKYRLTHRERYYHTTEVISKQV